MVRFLSYLVGDPTVNASFIPPWTLKFKSFQSISLDSPNNCLVACRDDKKEKLVCVNILQLFIVILVYCPEYNFGYLLAVVQ